VLSFLREWKAILGESRSNPYGDRCDDFYGDGRDDIYGDYDEESCSLENLAYATCLGLYLYYILVTILFCTTLPRLILYFKCNDVLLLGWQGVI
jgi:hypothetical protein